MSTHDPDPIYVRASVSAHCNLACVYCPKKEGMENRVPSSLRGQNLTVDEYSANLAHLARHGIRGVSFTGGEPTLNPNLPDLVARAANIFTRVELTTNGRFLTEMLPALTPNLDLLKVSLDAVDPVMVRSITKGTDAELDRAIASIRAGCAAGLRVGVNVVVMRSTADQIDAIVSLVRAINMQGFSGTAYVSLLDFYYSEEQRIFWQKEFFPIEELAENFGARYGPSNTQVRFGCRFYWFDADGVQVRFKDSKGATYRAAKCEKCSRYCQEGIYGLKHSAEGWVTTCPTGDPNFGVHLSPGLNASEVDRRLTSLLNDIRLAQPTPNSFETMVTTHALMRPTPSTVLLQKS